MTDFFEIISTLQPDAIHHQLENIEKELEKIRLSDKTGQATSDYDLLISTQSFLKLAEQFFIEKPIPPHLTNDNASYYVYLAMWLSKVKETHPQAERLASIAWKQQEEIKKRMRAEQVVSDEDDCLLSSEEVTPNIPRAVLPIEVVPPFLLPPSVTTPPLPETLHYNYTDFFELSQNEFSRYGKNSRKITYLLEQDDQRDRTKTLAFQFPTDVFQRPAGFVGEGDPAPEVLPVKTCGIMALPNGKMSMMAVTDSDLKMQARRRYHFSFESEGESEKYYTFYPLSPVENKPVFFPTSIKKFNDTEEGNKLKAMPHVVKSGGDLVVHNSDVLLRAQETRRIPDQKTVMGATGVELYKKAVLQYGNGFSDELRKILIDSSSVLHLKTLEAMKKRGEPIDPEDEKKAFLWRLFRTELLHRLAYVLHPLNMNPQRRDNLGAARMCHNTDMMVPERTAKRFATHVKNAVCQLQCQFDMLLDTEVIDSIHFIVSIAVAGIKIKIKQDIDALEKNPQFSKASDLAGLIAMLFFLIHKTKPAFAERVPVFSSASAFFSTTRKRERVEENEALSEVKNAA